MTEFTDGIASVPIVNCNSEPLILRCGTVVGEFIAHKNRENDETDYESDSSLEFYDPEKDDFDGKDFWRDYQRIPI